MMVDHFIPNLLPGIKTAADAKLELLSTLADLSQPRISQPRKNTSSMNFEKKLNQLHNSSFGCQSCNWISLQQKLVEEYNFVQ